MPAAYNRITETSQGSLVNILAWVFMVIMIMASATKIANTWYRKGLLALDDYLMAASVLVAIGQTVAEAEAVSHGLGDQEALTDGFDRTQYAQASYAADLLYVVTLYLTKATTAYFTGSFAPMPWVQRATLSLIYGHLAWTIISIFVLAFQCNLPHPWQFYDNQCLNLGAFWDFYAAVDILTDVALAAIPIMIVARIQTTRAQRLSVTSAFSTRFLTIPLIILRVFYLNQTYLTLRSNIYDEVRAAATTEIHMHMAIILTCVPFIKSVLDGLQGGVMTSDLRANPHATVRFGDGNDSNSYPLGSVSHRGRQKTMTSVVIPRSSSMARLHDASNNYQHSIISAPDRRSSSTPSPPGPGEIAVHTTITVTSSEQV